MNTTETPAAPAGINTAQGETNAPANAPVVGAVKSRKGKTKPTITGGTDNVPANLAEAAKSVQRLNAENVRLRGVAKTAQAENAKLRALVGSDGEQRYPVSGASLRKACDALIQATRNDPSKPARSLKSQFVLVGNDAAFVGKMETVPEDAKHVSPDLTDDSSKKTWRTARKEIDLLHSKWVREEKPKLIAEVKRLANNPKAILAGGRRKHAKTGKLVAARIGARLPAEKAKGTSKDAAKPTVSP